MGYYDIGSAAKFAVKDVTGAVTLTSSDYGVVSLNAAAGAAITLPAVTLTGAHYYFVVSTLFATSDWVISSAEGDNIEGALDIASTKTTVNAADSVTFELGAENIGDYIELISDGTSWLCSGSGLSASSLSSTG